MCLILRNIHKTDQTSQTREFVQENYFFQNFEKMKLSPKIGNLTHPESKMLYIGFNKSLNQGKIYLGHI
jgi:hypothetical protein